MGITRKHQADLAAICDSLRQAIVAPSTTASRQILSDTLARAERLAEWLEDGPAKPAKGRQTNAQGGPE